MFKYYWKCTLPGDSKFGVNGHETMRNMHKKVQFTSSYTLPHLAIGMCTEAFSHKR